MSKGTKHTPPPSTTSRLPSDHGRQTRGLVLVAVMFFLSGCAALTYEVVWFQLLRLTIGASSISLAMTLTAFMAGLGLGALAAPRLVGRGGQALWIYAALEAGIGLCGLAMPWLVPWISRGYVSLLDHGPGTGLVARALVCGLVLLPPTVLMGATLPVMARWLGSGRRAVAGVSWLYAINTFGAVCGTLLSGFLWLRYFSTTAAGGVAVALNFAAAGLAIWMACRPAYASRGGVDESDEAVEEAPDIQPASAAHPESAADDRTLRRRGLVVIGVSGFTALGAQVLWTRSIGLILAVTVYTFAIILAVFLTGLAIGSSLGAAAVKRTGRPGVWLAVTQLGMVLAIAWAFFAIDHLLPDMNGLGRRGPKGTAWRMFSDVVRVGVAILPATALWGASFPLVLALSAEPGGRSERWVARVYAANTAGAILGALGFTFLGFGVLGSDLSAHLLTAAAAVGAVILMRAAAVQEPLPTRDDGPRVRWRLKITPSETCVAVYQSARSLIDRWHGFVAQRGRTALAAMGLGVGVLAAFGPGVPTELLVYGHYQRMYPSLGYDILEAREGIAASAGVAQASRDVRTLHVSGKIVASSTVEDMRLQRMLGHLATVTHDRPRSVLIVGMGTGTTAGCFVLSPEIERIVICEIEPEVLQLAGRHFAQENHRVLEDPRTEVVIDDARHYLATTHETFDIITSDPIHPWVKGASALYSREYYRLVQQRLNPGGVVTQWVPFYETSEAAAKSMLATFFESFPEGSVWHAGDFGVGQDVVMIGHPDESALDLDRWLAGFESHPEILADLRAAGIRGEVSLLSRYSSHASDLSRWLGDAELNEDSSMRLEYLAGQGVFQSVQNTLLQEIESRRVWPNPHVRLSPDTTRQVAELIKQRQRDAARPSGEGGMQ